MGTRAEVGGDVFLNCEALVFLAFSVEKASPALSPALPRGREKYLVPTIPCITFFQVFGY